MIRARGPRFQAPRHTAKKWVVCGVRCAAVFLLLFRGPGGELRVHFHVGFREIFDFVSTRRLLFGACRIATIKERVGTWDLGGSPNLAAPVLISFC